MSKSASFNLIGLSTSGCAQMTVEEIVKVGVRVTLGLPLRKIYMTLGIFLETPILLAFP